MPCANFPATWDAISVPARATAAPSRTILGTSCSLLSIMPDFLRALLAALNPPPTAPTARSMPPATAPPAKPIAWAAARAPGRGCQWSRHPNSPSCVAIILRVSTPSSAISPQIPPDLPPAAMPASSAAGNVRKSSKMQTFMPGRQRVQNKFVPSPMVSTTLGFLSSSSSSEGGAGIAVSSSAPCARSFAADSSAAACCCSAAGPCSHAGLFSTAASSKSTSGSTSSSSDADASESISGCCTDCSSEIA
mmetsp:Transcript_116900/g.202064  ORF Transcript_116900/g.202064 Transcript_116900/m.202064 type:complete len:249 (+) Transcript_116900:469-1215(+)